MQPQRFWWRTAYTISGKFQTRALEGVDDGAAPADRVASSQWDVEQGFSLQCPADHWGNMVFRGFAEKKGCSGPLGH